VCIVEFAFFFGYYAVPFFFIVFPLGVALPSLLSSFNAGDLAEKYF